uniref:Uncharacterized protein n=1 Tax=Anguilla anguilla TaxID=7936 RepID=A0A0E9RK41_ANGAN
MGPNGTEQVSTKRHRATKHKLSSLDYKMAAFNIAPGTDFQIVNKKIKIQHSHFVMLHCKKVKRQC